MAIVLNTADVMDVDRYVIKTPNPADSVDAILKQLSEIENEIDSEQVNAEMDEIQTSGRFSSKNVKRQCFNIKLRNTETKELKKFGCIIYPVVFGNLVYLTKYEYLESWFGWTASEERDSKIRAKLTTIEKYNEYIFVKTLGDYIFCQLIKTNDKEYEGNMKLYSSYMRA